MTVKVAGSVQAPLHTIHEAVEHMAGVMGQGPRIGFDKLGGTRTQLENSR